MASAHAIPASIIYSLCEFKSNERRKKKATAYRSIRCTCGSLPDCTKVCSCATTRISLALPSKWPSNPLHVLTCTFFSFSHNIFVSISICRIRGINCTDRPIFGSFTLTTNTHPYVRFLHPNGLVSLFFFYSGCAYCGRQSAIRFCVYLFLHAAVLQLMCNISSPNSHFNVIVSLKQNKQWPICSISIFARFCRVFFFRSFVLWDVRECIAHSLANYFDESCLAKHKTFVSFTLLTV